MVSMQRRYVDHLSYLCLVCAFLLVGCGVASAFGQLSQETINALTDERLRLLTERIARLETGALWLAGALIANLGAHVFQIRGEVQRRRDRPNLVDER